MELNDIPFYRNLLQDTNRYVPDKQINITTLDLDGIYMKVIDGRIVSTAKLFIEKKLYQSVGHIEDVITVNSERGNGYGKDLVKTLISIGIEKGCYKVVLYCKDELEHFYSSCGMEKSGMFFTYRS